MFGAELNNVEKYCEEIGARYQVYMSGEKGDYKQIYVYGKKEYDLKKNHPRKYKNLYIPYLRISAPKGPGHSLYIRDNGWTQYAADEEIKRIIDDLNK